MMQVIDQRLIELVMDLFADTLPMANCQSVIQLAAGVNGGYFAFRSSSQSRFQKFLSHLDDVRALARRASKNNRALIPELSAANGFATKYEQREKSQEEYLNIVAFGIFVVYCFLLLVHTIWQANVNIIYISLVFAVGHLPVFILVFIDVRTNRKLKNQEVALFKLKLRLLAL